MFSWGSRGWKSEMKVWVDQDLSTCPEAASPPAPQSRWVWASEIFSSMWGQGRGSLTMGRENGGVSVPPSTLALASEGPKFLDARVINSPPGPLGRVMGS